MTSPSLRHKIAKTRAAAPSELPKARLCANVILAALEGEEAVQRAVAELKQGVGNNWSPVTAFQFMSGRRGEFAAECAAPEEKVHLLFAHLVARQVCEQEGLGAVLTPDNIDMAKLHAVALSVKAANRAPI